MARLLHCFVLLHVIVQGILFSGTWAWEVRMPGSIRGLYGSCLVIPCSFYYSKYPPRNPYRVVWYQYDSHWYPLVYDGWYRSKVIEKFRGKTSLYGNPYYRDCSLLIEDLNMAHHGETLYAWIDPENVGKSTYRFFDVTSKIHVETSPQSPNIQISGGSNIGDSISVHCSVHHTCPYSPPTLSLSGIDKKAGTNDRLEKTYISDGQYHITLIREGIVKAVSQRVHCSVRHYGGPYASSDRTHIAKCPFGSPLITPDSNTEFLEGVERDIICSITYTCPENRPYITWIGGQVSGNMSFIESGDRLEARSTLKFTAKASDNGREMTCRIEMKENVETVSITLNVKYLIEKPQMDIIGIPKVGEQLTLSCSVIHTVPTAPPTLKLSISRGTERLTNTPQHEGKWKLMKEITWDVQEDDSSVSCTVSYSSGQSSTTEVRFNSSCTFQEPKINPRENDVMEGVEKIFTCTVEHACQKQKPSLTWNFESMPTSIKTQKISSKLETVSTLKLIAGKDDHDKTLVCTAQLTEEESSDSIVLKVKRGMSSLNWTYSMPGKVKGLKGSCLVIPCIFEFKGTQPRDTMVKWYEYSSSNYPLVYDQNGKDVIGKFWKRTELSGSPSNGSCSLKINSLEMDLIGVRLFPWMDQIGVETFHKVNSDNCVELEVTEQAEKPKLSIIGVPRVGESITVTCSVHHTCPFSPPELKIGESPRTLKSERTQTKHGFWETTRNHTFKIKEDDKSITCRATFPSGQTSEGQIDLNAQCVHEDLMIEPNLADVTEGVAKNFTCKVVHSCKGQAPTITWNYEDMPETLKTKNRGSGWVTSSNLLFLASMEDQGEKLICSAKFPDDEITASVVLQVQKYVPKIVDPFENDTLHVYEANVVSKITALTRSCVVIPCTFEIGNETVTSLHGLWYTSSGDYVYHPGQTNILDNFKGRTKLLGEVDERNCTLEIDDIKAHDNGPFCFHAEKGNDKYRFNHSCVFIVMKATPNKPEISGLPEEMEPGQKFKISCSITHTCPTYPPTITWNIKTAKEVVSHMEGGAGQWKTTSTVTFIPTGYEIEEDLICSATFRKGKKQESTFPLPIRRYEGLRMDTIGPYILTPLLCLLVLFATLATGVVTCKRRVGKRGPVPKEDLMVEYNAMSETAEFSEPHLPQRKRNAF